MDTKNSKINVVMIPWLAHGHVSPFLELAKRLTQQNFFIHFCSTPIILESVKKRINKEQSQTIKLVEFHLPSLPDLPPHHHTTNGLANHLIPTLKDALDMASPSLLLTLKNINPDLVIYDFNMPKVPSIASSLNIPTVQFFITGVSMTCVGLHWMKNPEKKFEGRDVHPRYFKDFVFRGAKIAPGKSEGDRVSIYDTIFQCEMILVKTFQELEGENMDYFARLVDKKVLSVGQLVEKSGSGSEGNEITEWLDSKEKRSTVFVSFGSESFLTKEEIQELASGLELSNVNFLWTIRFAAGEEMDMDKTLPEGFLERVKERGKIVTGWAPQLKILSHSSIGGFVSHCGWSSMIESMGLGVPIIALPLHLDQPFNARLLEDLGVGIEVPRESDLAIKGDELAKTIRKVVVDEDQEPLRVKAREFGEIMKVREKEDIDIVVEELEKLCNKARDKAN